LWVRAPPGACGVNEPNFSEIYERILVPSLFRPWARDLLDRVSLAQGDRVLDVACGTGIVARLARERLGADSRITGVDINSEMIAVARSIEPDISWHRGNALELPFEKASMLSSVSRVFNFFPRSRGRGPRNATRSRGGRPDRLKHVATARRKPSFSMAWIARPRVNLVPAPIAVFRSAGVHPRLPADG
jgi:SAM-dependent methyltransferase